MNHQRYASGNHQRRSSPATSRPTTLRLRAASAALTSASTSAWTSTSSDFGLPPNRWPALGQRRHSATGDFGAGRHRRRGHNKKNNVQRTKAMLSARTARVDPARDAPIVMAKCREARHFYVNGLIAWSVHR